MIDLSSIIEMVPEILGLAVVVQILQEFYKYFTSSKYRSYAKALTDFLGPWAGQLLQPETIQDLQVSGPFQVRKLRPKGILLPMDREGLTGALERTAPHWIRKTIDQLKLECEFQNGGEAEPSPEWKNFLTELGEVEKGTPGYWNAYEVAQFLSVRDHNYSVNKDSDKIGEIIAPARLKAADILIAFRKKFLSHVDDASENFSQLERNFKYSYRRRNLRQTFVIAMTIAVIFNLPFQRIYKPPEKVTIPAELQTKMGEDAIAYFESRLESATSSNDSSYYRRQIDEVHEHLDSFIKSIAIQKDREHTDFIVNQQDIFGTSDNGLGTLLLFLFGCLFTAILVCVLAPLWNDITKSVYRFKRSRQPGTTKTDKG